MSTRSDPVIRADNPARATTRVLKPGAWSDWLATVRQAALRLPKLWPHLAPTFHLPSVAAIDAAFIDRHGIEGVIWDVDGTLMGCRHSAVAADLHAAVFAILAHHRVRHVILSNCSENRFLQLGTMFPSVPVLRGYATPAGTVFRRLVGTIDSWTGANHPSARLRQVRKPSAELVEYAVRELDLPPTRVILVGDQYLTDVAAANIAGVRSIKVPTWAPESFSVPVRLLQRIDTTFYQLSSLAGRRSSPSGSNR